MCNIPLAALAQWLSIFYAFNKRRYQSAFWRETEEATGKSYKSACNNYKNSVA
jgi:hypothetical protein